MPERFELISHFYILNFNEFFQMDPYRQDPDLHPV